MPDGIHVGDETYAAKMIGEVKRWRKRCLNVVIARYAITLI